MTEPSCPECRLVAGGASVRGTPPLRIGPFVVHPRQDAPPLPGWMVVAPARHVEQWDELDARELREIGPLLARVAAALRGETRTAKVYVSVFAEVLPHLHVHVVARPPDLPREKRGAALFLEPGPSEDRAADADLARRVYARLREGSPSPLTPVLLSALLWPGAGQLKNGDWAKGLALALAAAVVFGRFVWRVAEYALGAVLVAPEPMDLPQIIQLAEETRARTGGELGGLTLVLAVIWVASLFDAWWVGRHTR